MTDEIRRSLLDKAQSLPLRAVSLELDAPTHVTSAEEVNTRTHYSCGPALHPLARSCSSKYLDDV